MFHINFVERHCTHREKKNEMEKTKKKSHPLENLRTVFGAHLWTSGHSIIISNANGSNG